MSLVSLTLAARWGQHALPFVLIPFLATRRPHVGCYIRGSESFRISFGSLIPTPAPFGTVNAPSLISMGGSNHLPYVSTPFLYSCHGPSLPAHDAKCSK